MREQRKVVSILFADVVGSTELATQRDPEVVRALMGRYFKRIGEIAEAYGGTVEKFAGDAAMVVFGVPTVHDDDAERAVRAAIEIRDGSKEVAVRVGVNTGEAVTALSEDRQFMVSGDAVNVAARLQQGADAGEVVVGPVTFDLTRHLIDYEAREAIAAKGKPEAIPAHRALRARSAVPTQARGVPGLHAELVGRGRELRLLLDTFARAADDRSPHLFTVVGSAGIGKSRLIDEALQRLGASGARLLRGRCLPYGRGITYWPLIEMVRQDTGIELADERDQALRKLDRWLGEILRDDAQRPALRARLAVMLGFETAEGAIADTPADRVEREIGWAMRTYVETIATSGPLIVVVDDLQWAEPPVLAFIDQVAERAAAVPLLVVCIARPEFLESHAAWGAGKPNSTTITLDPLNADDVSTLVARLLEVEALPEGLRRQIVERSAGTPLFCEEFIHMLIDEGLLVHQDGSWRATGRVERIQVPLGINAVLAARLDLLPERERTLLQAASVIGERFGAAQLQSLLDASEVESDLDALRRKGLVAGADRLSDEYRFRHLLIHDAAYSSLPKSARAGLHDRFREWLETATGDPQQITEIIGHHAERSFTLSHELGLEAGVVVERAKHAVRWLFAIAERARTRHDVATLEAVLKMLRAAAAVLPAGDNRDIAARLRLLEAQLLLVQADYPGARAAAIEAASLAEDGNLPQTVATARLTEAWIWNWSGAGLEELNRLVLRAIEATRRAGDIRGEIEARQIGNNIAYSTGRLDEFAAVNLELLEQARSIGDEARAASILERLASTESIRGNQAGVDGYVTEAEAIASRLGLRNISLNLMRTRAIKLFRGADFAASEAAFRKFVAAAQEAGSVQQHVSALRFLAYSLQMQHRYREAADALDSAIALSETSGELWNRTEILALRARMAAELGDLPAAGGLIERAVSTLRDTDVTGVAEAMDSLGVIRAAQGRAAEAEAAFRRGFEAVADTEYLWPLGNLVVDFAAFLAARGQADQAQELIDRYASRAPGTSWRMFEADLARVRDLIRASR